MRPSQAPGPPSSTQKKQQSISSFFTPKSAPPPSTFRIRDVPPTIRSSSTTEETPTTTENGLFVSDNERDVGGSRKPSLSAKRSVGEDDVVHAPAAKRRKGSVEETTLLSASRSSLSPVSDPPFGKKPNITARTSKYAFSSAPLPLNDENEEEDDEEVRKMKERLHKKFVQKLGNPDSMASIRRRNGLLSEETQAEEEEAGEDEEGEEEATPQPAKKSRKTPAMKTKKLTPLEQEVVTLKRKHPDTLLVMEVGYKYRIFGEDARSAAKALAIVCIPGKFRFDEHPSEAHLNRFASASFPTHRLHVHVKRLVAAGHKVGIVRQLETAALKAAGSNRNKLFERGLTNLYTKGTYIDDQDGMEVGGASGGAPATGHLLCLTESYPKGSGSDEKVQIGMIAVQPSTGDIIYDDFEDGWMRSELETRLLHISPCEFLIVGELSKATEKLVRHLSGGDSARVERADKPKTMAAMAYSHITSFYANKMKAGEPSSSQIESSQETGTLLDKAHKLSENATICLSAMITHLTEYGLQHVFDLTKYFQSFSARSHMLLNGNTLTSLEVYRNQTDQAERGSLFWTLDRTQTKFGKRLLRKWVGRPLLDRKSLDERVAAVDELKNGTGMVAVDRISRSLRNIRADLERTLIRIYYKKCTRAELLSLLQILQSVAGDFVDVTSASKAGFESTLINEAVASLPQISDQVIDYLNRINAQAARENDKYSFFRDEYETEDMIDHKLGIAAVEHELDEFRKEAAATLKRQKVTYVTCNDIDFLIELPNRELKNVPASWIKISGTKAVSRYHAPKVIQKIRERDQHKEALSNACDAAFTAFLMEIGSKYQAFRDCIQSLALLDCLLSLSEVAQQPGYTKPTFTSEPGISIKAGRHPMVEQLLLDSFVPNDVHLSSSETRALLITGPNMGGKSSYVRSVALIAIMAQIGSHVPAEAAELGLLDAVFTRMGAFDNMLKGESTFMVELGETSDILKQATPRSLVILDELGRGTSTHDGVAIAQSVLRHMVDRIQSFTLFITHYQSLARVAEQFPRGELRNVHMRFTERASESATAAAGEMDITFLYEVGEGVAHRSYGLNVARLAGLPRSLLEEAGRRSQAMEAEEGRRKMTSLAKAMDEVVGVDGEVGLQRLVSGIEQL